MRKIQRWIEWCKWQRRISESNGWTLWTLSLSTLSHLATVNKIIICVRCVFLGMSSVRLTYRFLGIPKIGRFPITICDYLSHIQCNSRQKKNCFEYFQLSLTISWNFEHTTKNKQNVPKFWVDIEYKMRCSRAQKLTWCSAGHLWRRLSESNILR